MWKALSNRRVQLGLAFLATLLALAVWPSSVEVDLGTAERGPLLVTVDEEGETRVRDRFVISAPVSGRVLRIDLEPGDPVRKGETLLARFQPASPTPLDARSRAEATSRVAAAEAALGGARADRERARAQLEYARSELARHQELAGEAIVSQSQLDQVQQAARSAGEAMRAAEFGVASAEHQVAIARASLLELSRPDGSRAFEMLSPVDGVVLERMRWSESVVQAGEPLLELGDPRALEIVSDMLSTDAVRVGVGDRVLIEQWGGEQSLAGRVRRVEPSGFTKVSALGVEEQRVDVVIDIEDPGEVWSALGDAYRVEVRVVVWESDDVLKVPTSSLLRSGDGWAVFVVRGGRARLQPIEVGRRNGLAAEVSSGLAAGDAVVRYPSDAVADGVRVEPRAN
jgi:HlyD family secretion protein